MIADCGLRKDWTRIRGNSRWVGAVQSARRDTKYFEKLKVSDAFQVSVGLAHIRDGPTLPPSISTSAQLHQNNHEIDLLFQYLELIFKIWPRDNSMQTQLIKKTPRILYNPLKSLLLLSSKLTRQDEWSLYHTWQPLPNRFVIQWIHYDRLG